jgi:starch-binding outer membrane protein, SusD/RagB family
MKINIKTGMMAAAITIFTGISTVSCKKDYLNVTDPNVFSADNYPATVADINNELNDLYGRLRGGYYKAENFAYFALSRSHSSDLNYNDPNFNAAGQLNYQASNQDVDLLWNTHYENIAKCLNTINDIARFRIKNPNLSTDDKAAVDLMEGQARFIRAWNYMLLVNFFGETMINADADKAKMGVPIITKLATTVAETQIPRKTIGEVWDYIVADLKAAEILLTGKTWDGADISRISGWAVKGMLGKAYIYTQQWPLASAKLKEVIDGSGKTLVPFNEYKEMFNGKFEFNNESLVEVNFIADPLNPYNSDDGVGNHLSLLTSPAYINDNGESQPNGYGNYFIHDKNLIRFGFTGTAVTPDELQNPDYLIASATARDTKTTDPRLWVVAYQPYLDSLPLDGVSRPVGKIEGLTTDVQAWSWHKYVMADKISESSTIANGNNMFILRLADVYLLYAEAAAKTGNTADALEYINKVHRRAYNQPVDAPSSFDYASLTAVTKAPDPALSNDPLKYERWAELFGEGTWWFDVNRWKLGQTEATYYQKLTVGNLTWDDTKYALPIPLREINTNTVIAQNPGY